MKRLSDWWTEITIQWAARRLMRMMKRIKRESQFSIQLTEFNGEIYISHNGAPIVCAKYLNKDVVEVLKLSRQSWTDYQLYNLDLKSIND